MALCPQLSHTHTHTHKHTNTRIPPPVSVGEGYYLMESWFFFFSLLSPFPQTPCLPCQENNESTKPFVRTSTQHFHLRRPPIPKKNNPRCIRTSPMLSRRCLTSTPPPPLLVLTPACPPRFWQHVHDARLFFPVISSARSRCARDYCKMKVWGGGGEAVRGRKGGTKWETKSRGPSLSAGVEMVTSAGRREGDRCADCTYCLECVSSA